jgi:hypothetical protein
MKTTHEMILSYMTLTQNHGQVGYPQLHEAMELSWYKLFKNTDESHISKWVYVTNGIAKLPRTVERLSGIFVFDECGNLVPFYEDLIKNILPPLKERCSCDSCDEGECLCPSIKNDSYSFVDVVFNGITYQNKYFTRVLKNGSVVEESHVWAAEYDIDGEFVKATEVSNQTTKCTVDVKPCGCPVKSEANSKKLLSAGCIKHECAPYLREQYPSVYSSIGYYKVDRDNREVHIFDADGKKSSITQVMLSYESNGNDMLVPQYAYSALLALLDWTRKQFSPMFKWQDAKAAKRHFKAEKSEMIKYLNPIPYQLFVETANPFVKGYRSHAHSDFIPNKIEPIQVCTTGTAATPAIVNNFYSTEEKYLKRIVDGPEADSPVSGTNVYQNNLLKNIGKNSADRIEIIISGFEMYNWGENKSFDFDKTTGTITMLGGYVFQPNASLKIDLRQ